MQMVYSIIHHYTQGPFYITRNAIHSTMTSYSSSVSTFWNASVKNKKKKKIEKEKKKDT